MAGKLAVWLLVLGLTACAGASDPPAMAPDSGTERGGTGGAAARGGAGGMGGMPAAGRAGATAGSGGLPAADSGMPMRDAGQPDGACGLTTFESGRTPARELHVSTQGSAQGDGSAARPFATIAQAARAATPGTAIVVHSGMYAGGNFIDGLRGSAEAPIWIGGAANEDRPRIEGGSDAMHLVRVRHLIVHDLEISGTSANGINCDDGSAYSDEDATRHVIFRDLNIHDIGGDGNQDCLKLSGVNDFFVLDSELAHCGGGQSGSGIDHVGCHRGLIARNRFSDMSGNGVQTKGGSADIEIRQNVFLRGGQRALNLGGSTGTEFFRPPLSTSAPNAEARRIRAIANVIQAGVAGIAFVGCVECLAANNTIVRTERWSLRILQESVSAGSYMFAPASDGSFVNNIVEYATAAGSVVNVGANTAPETFRFRNNLWYAHDNPSAAKPQLPAAESGGLSGMAPGFAAAGDFGLASGSPAAGAGTAVPEATCDHRGRAWSSPPSIGAFERP